MALEELLNTLKENEQKQIEDIWQAAKNEAEVLHRHVDEAITDISKKHADQLASACRKSMRSIFAEAETTTRERKLYAYQALDQALLNTAGKLIPLLREKNYEKIFEDLIAELPERQWEKIVVSPFDLELAAKFFSPDIIRPDPAIIGGLIAITAEDRIIVDNTFSKRLERKWLQIRPAIIAEIEKRYETPGTAENTG